jgi:septal ring factor EnvC (AmiA/AmiB activator)
MTRRRLIRPRDNVPPPRPNRERALQKLRVRLQQERTALARWQKKLKRAFNTVTKLQKSIARIERQLTKKEEP